MRNIHSALLVALAALATGACAQTDEARALLNQGQAQQAADVYGQRIAREPGDPDHWLGRALARIRLGQWPGAMADLEKAVALAPGYADAWSSLADVYRWNDRPAAAADAYARLAALRPNDPQVQVLRARSLMAAGDTEGAKLAVQRARELGAAEDSLPQLTVAAQMAERGGTAVDMPNQPVASGGHRWALSAGAARTSSGAASAQDNSVALRHYSAYGSIAVERLGLRRFGESDQAWAIDAYPRLWQGAYANVRYQRADTPDLYPPRAWRAELYQNISGGWEAAISRDFLGFGSGVRIDGVSMGKYWGNFFARWRHQQVKSDSSSGSGDRLFVRYYYEGDADHYLEANVSRGRSDDFSSALIRASRSDSRGLVWMHFVTRDWGYKLSASRSADSSGYGAQASDVGISLTRRW
jgi:YaiO family outer membrane protein